MTPESKRAAIAMAMGFKDADFLKWHDGMYEAQQWLIDRQKEKNDECWNLYASHLFEATKDMSLGHGHATLIRAIHATVEQKQDAFLKAIGITP